MSYKGNPGTNKLANVLSERMKREGKSPLVLDFGEILPDGSLVTNTFPVPVPKGDYSVLRSLTLGKAEDVLTTTSHKEDDGEHEGHSAGTGSHSHNILLPEKMRSVGPGDRVLVAWVQNEAVVVDIVTRS